PEQRRARSAAGGAGRGPVREAQDRGGVRGGQAGGGAGALRGPELGGVAPPRDPVPGGAVGPVLRAAGGGGGKPRTAAAPRRGEVFSRLRRRPAPSPERIAAAVTRALWRKEAARIYKWHKATGRFPPRRPRPDTS